MPANADLRRETPEYRPPVDEVLALIERGLDGSSDAFLGLALRVFEHLYRNKTCRTGSSYRRSIG